jgi:hypothetical protein
MAEISLAELLSMGDLDGLVRHADRLANAADWNQLLVLRDRCNEAAELTGKQLWGAAQYAEYRLALDAPGELAASVVVSGAARFALGPLTEVVAQHHAWKELADHLPDPASASVVAQERILRGEDLRDDPRAGLDETGLPGILHPFEPSYALPTYRPDELLESGPAEPTGAARGLTDIPGPPAEAPELQDALADAVDHWQTQSTGEVWTATVDGPIDAAIGALTRGEVHLVELSVPAALGLIAWCAASGAAHAPRRGMGPGRSAAWWVAVQAAGLDWPPDPDELEYELEELRWWTWSTEGDEQGWRLRIAVEDPADDLTVAIDAFDRRVHTDTDDES